VSQGALRLDSVHFGFGRGDRAVLDGITLQVPAGTVLVVRGRNGSGKSTLLRLAAGILHPVSGAVQRPRLVGYQPQVAGDPPPRTSAGSWLTTIGRMRDRAGGAVGVGLLEQLGVRPDLPLAACSRGTLAKVLLAAALAGPPELVVLDEPFATLDDAARHAAAALVRRAADDGAAVLLADHGDRDVLAARIVELRGGRLTEWAAPRGPAAWRLVTVGPDGVERVQVVAEADRDRTLLDVLLAGGEVRRVERWP
jgi:ABC-2 type transport system ATP-binding protein